MDKLNRAAVAYIVAALFIASIAALTPVAIVVAQNNTTMDTNTTTGVENTTQAQGSTPQFSTNLTGELTFPPTVTNATGSGEFTVVGDGNTMRYKIDANNIDKVTDVFVAASSGGRYVDLVQLRSGVNEGISGPINGTLVEGNFTSTDFSGRLNVDQMSDLLKLILDGNAYIRVQTFDAPLGKIVGKITPNLPQ
ncbi:MAG: CHRD domain-containing protein [Nitrososphaeraceae archaeon]